MDPTKMPSGKAPPGQSYDFNSPENRSTLYITVSSILLGLTVTFVSLKLYMRLFIQRKPGWDDAATVIATIGQTAYTAIVIWNMDRGAARHMWDVPLATFLKEISLSTDLAIIQQPTLLATKFALFGLYYRLFAPKLAIKYAIIAGIMFCTVIYTAMMFMFIFIKSNVQLILINKALGVLNLVTDLYILVLPMVAISGLHMATRKKFGVAAVFMSGMLAVVMSVISLVYRFQLTTTTSDISWDFVAKYIAMTVEIDIGIICGCLPVLPALFQKSGATKWWSSIFKILTSRLLGSRSRTEQSSSKGSKDYNLKMNSKDENYVELHEGQSTRKLNSTFVSSSLRESTSRGMV